MPYRVPDTFFDDVENTIMINMRKRQNRRNVFKIFYRIIAVAATLALFLVLTICPRQTRHICLKCIKTIFL